MSRAERGADEELSVSLSQSCVLVVHTAFTQLPIWRRLASRWPTALLPIQLSVYNALGSTLRIRVKLARPGARFQNDYSST